LVTKVKVANQTGRREIGRGNGPRRWGRAHAGKQYRVTSVRPTKSVKNVKYNGGGKRGGAGGSKNFVNHQEGLEKGQRKAELPLSIKRVPREKKGLWRRYGVGVGNGKNGS